MNFNPNTPEYNGEYYAGHGDIEYLQLLDTARRMFDADPEWPNLSMLYTPDWNGFVEGEIWHAWWVQNSYGTTFSALPFLTEPFLTFLQNAQNLWFKNMGDGKTEFTFTLSPQRIFQWIPPDGSLCDCASNSIVVHKQGDGRVELHDWGMEFTAAGLLMQAELLLIHRDMESISHYLPILERCADFLETRRDPKNNLYLAGPAGNLLAPSFAGYKKPDGSYGFAYLTGLSITTIAALNRLIELELLAGCQQNAEMYITRRNLSLEGVRSMQTEEGYFIKSLDPDGTRHGVLGESRHGYFESSPNHDAIAFGIVDTAQALNIYNKIASIPKLRPFDFIIPNYPGYDDMYPPPEGKEFEKLWSYGTWVNGGHWSTCEARMILAYYRLGKYNDARQSMKRIVHMARIFRLDNPLSNFGSEELQADRPYNLCYDTFGPAAAFMRGLFEYQYTADSLTLIPHIPSSISEMQQKFLVCFGNKRLYISTAGVGAISSVTINGHSWDNHTRESVVLPFSTIPELSHVHINMGSCDTTSHAMETIEISSRDVPTIDPCTLPEKAVALRKPVDQVQRFVRFLVSEDLTDTYEYHHSIFFLHSVAALVRREVLKSKSNHEAMPDSFNQDIDQLYTDTSCRIYEGLDKHLMSPPAPINAIQARLIEIWKRCHKDAN